MKIINRALAITTVCLLAACGSDDTTNTDTELVVDPLSVADDVYQNGYIYTSDSQQSIAQAIAVKSGEIIYVGDMQGVQDFISEDTRVHDLESKMMLPGLHDAHLHPTGIVDLDVCDLGLEQMNLDRLVAALSACKVKYQYGEGETIFVLQWNSYVGNEPTAEYPSLIAALDAISTTQAVYLAGPDGHSAAANSFAFSQVKNENGEVVGLNRSTLAGEFSQYRAFVGVDGEGQPNGNLTESAVHLVGVPNFLYPLQQNPQELPKIAQKLNKYGITSVQDAWASAEELALYKTLADSGNMTFRLTAAQAYSAEAHVKAGVVDYLALIAEVETTRDSLDSYPYMKADAVKIMVDGVQEGSLIEVPPTLPTSVMVSHYKQPIVNLSQLDEGVVTLDGYVDLDSSLCQMVREQSQDYDDLSESNAFMATHGYHPSQCNKEKGEALAASGDTLILNEEGVSPIDFLNTFVTKLDAANFTVHMHAVGDGAVRAAIDAIEMAKQSNEASVLPHAIAHMQVVHPDDQQRLGELGIYLAFTYGWAIPDYYYDLSVMPFLDELANLEPDTIYDEANYYMQATYPTKTAKDAGAVLIAGSDAPVDTREPVPFSHMATGMTRNDFVGDDLFALNANQTLSVHEMIAAYTINGAKALRQDDIVGSIEVGKRADLIIIDRNIVELAESDDPERVYDVYETQVLATIFDGTLVYEAPAAQ